MATNQIDANRSDDLSEAFETAIQIDNQIKALKGTPIAKFDKEKRQAYLEYPIKRRSRKKA